MDIDLLIIVLVSVSIVISLLTLGLVAYSLKRKNRILKNIYQKFEERCTNIQRETPNYCNDFCASAVYEFFLRDRNKIKS